MQPLATTRDKSDVALESSSGLQSDLSPFLRTSTRTWTLWLRLGPTRLRLTAAWLGSNCTVL